MLLLLAVAMGLPEKKLLNLTCHTPHFASRKGCGEGFVAGNLASSTPL